MAEIIAEGTARAGGKTYRLAIESDMVKQLQRRTGWKPKKILKALLAKEGDLRLLRLVCHVALMRHHPTASIEEAGDIVSEDLAGLGSVIMAGASVWRSPIGNRSTLH